jgi:hypothetical protein
VYDNANCTAYNTYFPVETVGCRDNVIYNCSANNASLPIPAGEKFVTQLYYETSHEPLQPNCTGQVQYFVGQANEHCFRTQAGSQYNEYPILKVYTSDDCKGDYTINTDIDECTVDQVFSTGGEISYTHFNTTLLGKIRANLYLSFGKSCFIVMSPLHMERYLLRACVTEYLQRAHLTTRPMTTATAATTTTSSTTMPR